MTKTELITLTAAILRTMGTPRFPAVQEAYEIHDAIEEIENNAERRREQRQKGCDYCAGTGNVAGPGPEFVAMPCPKCAPAPPADTSSRGRYPGLPVKG